MSSGASSGAMPVPVPSSGAMPSSGAEFRCQATEPEDPCGSGASSGARLPNLGRFRGSLGSSSQRPGLFGSENPTERRLQMVQKQIRSTRSSGPGPEPENSYPLFVQALAQPRAPVFDHTGGRKTGRENRIRPETTVRRRARPGIVFGFLHHPRTHRILFHIADRLPEVHLVQGTGEEPTLPQVASESLPAKEVPGVLRMSIMNRPGQGLRRSRHHHMMHMVGHQTVGPNLQEVLFSIAMEEIQIRFPVLIGQENGRSEVSSLGHVKRQVRQYDSGQTTHSPSPHTASTRAPSARATTDSTGIEPPGEVLPEVR